MVNGPVLLELGVRPEVGAATSSFIIVRFQYNCSVLAAALPMLCCVNISGQCLIYLLSFLLLSLDLHSALNHEPILCDWGSVLGHGIVVLHNGTCLCADGSVRRLMGCEEVSEELHH